MGRVFKDYKELIESNRDIFTLLEKNGFSGVVKAAWYARQPEIDEIEYELNLLAKASTDLDEINIDLMDENEALDKKCKQVSASNYLLENENRKHLSGSERMKEINKKMKRKLDTVSLQSTKNKEAFEKLNKKFKKLNSRYDSAMSDLQVVTESRDSLDSKISEYEVVAKNATIKADTLQKERDLFEVKAKQSKRDAAEMRSYAQDLKEYAVKLKKYPWEKRISSSRGEVAPKRSTSLFKDL